MYIIILKPNKPIDMLEKLIEKVISSRLQFHSIASNFTYLSQLGGTKQYSTTDTSILIYLIYIRWMKGLHMSTLTFDIV